MPKKKTSSYRLSEVASIVSHQLKTPLSAIKGYLDVLLSQELGQLNLSQEEYLKIIQENTRRMIDLVKDFLDVSQIEEGKLELKKSRVNLEEIIRQAIKEFEPLIEAKNCDLSFEAEAKLPRIWADASKVKQVVVNLISNAIEYNKRKGTVRLFLKKKGNHLVFCCEDTGIGIDKKEQEKVFSKFYRSEKAIARSTGGSGLGLFISRAIIASHQGKIWFNSKEGEGSVFCFSLPLKHLKTYAGK